MNIKRSAKERRERAPKGELPLLQLGKWIKSRTIRRVLITNGLAIAVYAAGLVPAPYDVLALAIVNAAQTIYSRIQTTEPLAAKK